MTDTTTAGPRTGSDFAALSRRITEAGLMRRRPGYYALRFTLVGALAAATATAFLVLGPTPWQLLVAVAAAFTYGQVALLAHDVAHRQVFRGRAASAAVGRLLGNLGIGMSYAAWQDKHTRHHAHPNHEGLDPDVEPGTIAFTPAQAARSRGINRFLIRHQRLLFFPELSLAGVDLRVSSVRRLIDNPYPRRGLEAVLLAGHVLGYLAVVFLLLPWPLALGFVAVHQALFGIYLGSMFAPNHKGMEMPTGKMDRLRTQVVTSRNVSGGRFTDRPLHWLMGGLNHQIEHHLFPSMPTPNLRAARPIVKQFCAERGVSYHETGLIRSWQEILQALHEAGEPLRAEL